MKKITTILFGCSIAVCLISNSCRKSDDIPKCPTITITGCQPIPESISPIGYNVIKVGRHLRTVSCNPNNDDEFVFWASGPQYSFADNDTLFVYSKATGLTKQILVTSMWYPPQWGHNLCIFIRWPQRIA